MTGDAVHIAVVGSVNLDLTVSVERLPRAGETISSGVLSRSPGGKGANQALAARRLGAAVSLLACVGDDAHADEALALLRADGVDLSRVIVDPEAATGVALIAVDASGENQIVVAPGANRRLTMQRIAVPDADALICQLEVPPDVLVDATRGFRGFVCINLAPVMPVPDELVRRADLIVVNEVEAGHYAELLQRAHALVAVTRGRGSAVLRRGAEVLARVTPPGIEAVDTTGAGDTFTAALVLGLSERQPPAEALGFACAAAAASARQRGAQPGMPRRDEVERIRAIQGPST